MLYYATGVLFSAHNSQGKNINERERAHAENGDFVNTEFSHAWRPFSMLSAIWQLNINWRVSSKRRTDCEKNLDLRRNYLHRK
jgi:hypothetical protein